MLGRKQQPELEQPTNVVPLRTPSTARDAAEHESLVKLHEARDAHGRAVELTSQAERAMMDAERMMTDARREVRRASER